MNEKPRVSIIIPCKEIDNYTVQCINTCTKLNYDNFEITVLPDSKSEKEFKNTKIIPTGSVRPSRKRNIAALATNAEILAFIDSDAYPEMDWLKHGVSFLEKERIGLVGGPNLLPQDDGFLKKVSDDILTSAAGLGPFRHRYKTGKKRFENELPSCNMIIKKTLFDNIGGFDEQLLTAEDSKLCFNIIKKKKKILFSPDVIVFHHRRSVFIPHLRQMWNYGRDKATIINEFKLKGKKIYFIPAAFIFYLFTGLIVSILTLSSIPIISSIYITTLILYMMVILIASFIKSPVRFLMSFIGIFLTHISYGLGFIYGLLKTK